MRISTAQYYASTAANYQRTMSDLIKTGNQASSGIRVETAGDDPVGAARLLQLSQQSAQLDQYSGNIKNASSSLTQQESVLTEVTNLLQRAQELVVGVGNATYTDADRQSNSKELSQIESQLLSLMNSRDANGNYIFAGSKSSTVPFVKNSDGSYSYQGDQQQLSLQVGDTLSVATNDTGWKIFQQAVNTARSQVTQTAPATDDGYVHLSDGAVSNDSTYSSSFRSGEPYTVTFLSSTQYKITDKDNNDVTAETSKNGVFDPTAEGGSSISLRGLDLQLNINLPSGTAAGADSDALVAGHTFTLQSKPDSFGATRSPGNTSSAQITGTSITDQAVYSSSFPSTGAVLKFTSATTFEYYQAPLTDTSKPLGTGTVAGSTATAAGVSFDLSGTPANGDTFQVSVDTHRTQNVLNSLADLRSLLDGNIDGDTSARQNLTSAIAQTLGNLKNATEQVTTVVSDVGARQNTLDAQTQQISTVSLNNTSTQSSIRDTDPAEVLTRLTLQQTKLQAAQLVFRTISQLSLFKN